MQLSFFKVIAWLVFSLITNSFSYSLIVKVFEKNHSEYIYSNYVKPTSEKFSLEFNKVALAYNNHVGNEWSYYAKINDKVLYSGEKISISINENQFIRLTCYLSEAKEKHIDSANETYKLTYSDFVKYKDKGFYIPVTIIEGNGRYAGNSAQMNFHFNIR